MDTRERSERIMLFILGISVLGLVVALIALSRRINEYDPIDYSVQRIEFVTEGGHVRVPKVGGFDPIPAVRPGSHVPATGTVCVESAQEVEVLSDVWWSSVNPTGFRVQVADDTPGVLEPGCRVVNFDNEMPPDVARKAIEIGAPTLWNISGSTRPTRAGSLASVWETEQFWIVP